MEILERWEGTTILTACWFHNKYGLKQNNTSRTDLKQSDASTRVDEARDDDLLSASTDTQDDDMDTNASEDRYVTEEIQSCLSVIELGSLDLISSHPSDYDDDDSSEPSDYDDYDSSEPSDYDDYNSSEPTDYDDDDGSSYLDYASSCDSAVRYIRKDDISLILQFLEKDATFGKDVSKANLNAVRSDHEHNVVGECLDLTSSCDSAVQYTRKDDIGAILQTFAKYTPLSKDLPMSNQDHTYEASVGKVDFGSSCDSAVQYIRKDDVGAIPQSLIKSPFTENDVSKVEQSTIFEHKQCIIPINQDHPQDSVEESLNLASPCGTNACSVRKGDLSVNCLEKDYGTIQADVSKSEYDAAIRYKENMISTHQVYTQNTIDEYLDSACSNDIADHCSYTHYDSNVSHSLSRSFTLGEEISKANKTATRYKDSVILMKQDQAQDSSDVCSDCTVSCDSVTHYKAKDDVPVIPQRLREDATFVENVVKTDHDNAVACKGNIDTRCQNHRNDFGKDCLDFGSPQNCCKDGTSIAHRSSAKSATFGDVPEANRFTTEEPMHCLVPLREELQNNNAFDDESEVQVRCHEYDNPSCVELDFSTIAHQSSAKGATFGDVMEVIRFTTMKPKHSLVPLHEERHYKNDAVDDKCEVEGLYNQNDDSSCVESDFSTVSTVDFIHKGSNSVLRREHTNEEALGHKYYLTNHENAEVRELFQHESSKRIAECDWIQRTVQVTGCNTWEGEGNIMDSFLNLTRLHTLLKSKQAPLFERSSLVAGNGTDPTREIQSMFQNRCDGNKCNGRITMSDEEGCALIERSSTVLLRNIPCDISQQHQCLAECQGEAATKEENDMQQLSQKEALDFLQFALESPSPSLLSESFNYENESNWLPSLDASSPNNQNNTKCNNFISASKQEINDKIAITSVLKALLPVSCNSGSNSALLQKIPTSIERPNIAQKDFRNFESCRSNTICKNYSQTNATNVAAPPQVSRKPIENVVNHIPLSLYRRNPLAASRDPGLDQELSISSSSSSTTRHTVSFPSLHASSDTYGFAKMMCIQSQSTIDSCSSIQSLLDKGSVKTLVASESISLVTARKRRASNLENFKSLLNRALAYPDDLRNQPIFTPAE